MKSALAWYARDASTPDRDARPSRYREQLHGEAVVDLGHAGRRPGGPLGFPAFSPGVHLAAKDHLASIRLDGDLVRLQCGVALQRLLDLPPDLRGRRARRDVDQVGDALHALQPANRPLGELLLIVPLRLALEGDPAVVDHRRDVLVAEGQLAFDRGDGLTGDLGIGTLVRTWQAHFEIVGKAHHARHTLGVPLGFELLAVAAHEAR